MRQYHELGDWLLVTEVWSHFQTGRKCFKYVLSKGENTYPRIEYSKVTTDSFLYIKYGPRLEYTQAIGLSYRDAKREVLKYLLKV